jgi:hypothetical protein
VARPDFGAVVTLGFGAVVIRGFVAAALVDGPDALTVFGTEGLATVVLGPLGVLGGFIARSGATATVQTAVKPTSQMVERRMTDLLRRAKTQSPYRLGWLAW